MINRVILLVLDGMGIGPLPDAAAYGDADSNSIAHLADAAGGVALTNLESLGLGHVVHVKGVRTMGQPNGCFGRVAFSSRGKDSVVGNWEISGVIVTDGAVPLSGLSGGHTATLEEVFGRKIVAQPVGSLTGMLGQYGHEHAASGAPIVWTDGQHAVHVAVHESLMPVPALHQRCREARKILASSGMPVRVVAHSFEGGAGGYRVTARRDFVSEPPGVTISDLLNRASQIIMGVGKAADLFSGRGFTRSFAAPSATEAFEEALGMLSKVPRGLLYVSIGPFPDEPVEAVSALQEFDRRLPELFDKLRVGDMVIMTADHGRDLSRPGKTSTREYAPLLVTGPKLAQGVNLGTRSTAADLGQTIVEALRAERLSVGESFLEALRSG